MRLFASSTLLSRQGRRRREGEKEESPRTFLSVQSHLFPIKILFTPSEACCSTFACHVRMSVDAEELVNRSEVQKTYLRTSSGRRSVREEGGKSERTVETPLVGNVVDKEDTHSATVVSSGDGTEALLAGGIPLRTRKSRNEQEHQSPVSADTVS